MVAYRSSDENHHKSPRAALQGTSRPGQTSQTRSRRHARPPLTTADSNKLQTLVEQATRNKGRAECPRSRASTQKRDHVRARGRRARHGRGTSAPHALPTAATARTPNGAIRCANKYNTQPRVATTRSPAPPRRRDASKAGEAAQPHEHPRECSSRRRPRRDRAARPRRPRGCGTQVSRGRQTRQGRALPVRRGAGQRR